MKKNILITGAAGFIGFHLTQALSKTESTIIAIDELNDYYDTNLKLARLNELEIKPSSDIKVWKSKKYNIEFYKTATYDIKAIEHLFKTKQFDYVIHLAAQAGVRNSITNPYKYTKSNIEGFLPILEGCRNYPIKHLLYASSSSVYGNNSQIPFEESDMANNPISLYAATKKANELMAHTYSHLYDIPTTGLRFFTVYGPWGRPDMAYFKFANAITQNKPIDVYNNGNLRRDFTYIDDIIKGIVDLIKTPLKNRPKYEIFNIGNSSPINLMDFISILEANFEQKAIKNYLPMQPGDVNETYASTKKLENLINYSPKTNIIEGIKHFSDWYKTYYIK